MKPTIWELLEQSERGAFTDSRSGKELAERVEAVLRFCRDDKKLWDGDLEHADPVVRAMARGRISAVEQVMLALIGGR